MDEVVALYSEAGQQVGEQLRSVVRRDNLRHGATGILVYNSAGAVYVHQRTWVKDVYPGKLDFCCGGVLLAGEDPDEGARREAFEELGVTGVPLINLGIRDYSDEVTRFVCFQYECVFDGPIVWQPSEVLGGQWVEPDELRAHIRRTPDDFVADSVDLAFDLIRTR